MFDSTHPPLLVQPIATQQSTLFPSHEGYCAHYLSDERSLVSYKDGWTFPLSVQQQRFITASPLLLVRDSGGITTSSSTLTKGYAHQFCQENGDDPVFLYKQGIFPDRPAIEWMLVPDTVTMIWLQYGNKNQYCGDSSFDMERNYFGKLLIRNFVIQEDFAPGFDKKADRMQNAKLYRVESKHLMNMDWSEKDQFPEKHLEELLSSNDLDRYHAAVMAALTRASAS